MEKISISERKKGDLELDEEVGGSEPPEALTDKIVTNEPKHNAGFNFDADAAQELDTSESKPKSIRFQKEEVSRPDNNISNENQSAVPVSNETHQMVVSIPDDLIIQTDRITIGKKIGSGGFSDVFAATYNWEDGSDAVALKSIKLENFEYSKKEIENIEREVMLLRSFRIHENVVTILGACSNAVIKDEKGIEMNIQFGLMMEISHTGSLFKFLKNPNSLLSEDFCLYTSFDIANGLLALHSHKESPIIHRDVKSLNVLLFPNDARKGFIAKISDFGLARMKKLSTVNATKKAGVGTPNWLPPESYDGRYKEASDVWEFGMVMYEIASRSIPFEGCQDNEIMKKVVLNRDLPDLSNVKSYFPEDLLVIMKACWIYEDEDRPDFQTVVGILSEKLNKRGLITFSVKKKSSNNMRGSSTNVEERMHFVRALAMIEEQLKKQTCQDIVLYNNAWMGLEVDSKTPLLLESIARLSSSHSEAPSQPSRLKTVNDLILDANSCSKSYHHSLQLLVESAGGSYVSGKIKDRDRCTSKVENEYGGDAGRLVDVIRGAGVFVSCADMYEMFQEMEKSSTIAIVRCKDRLNKPLESGYRDVILNITLKDSASLEPQIAELQLRLKPIHDLYAQSHRTYEIQRIIPVMESGQNNFKWNKKKKLCLGVFICLIVALVTGLSIGFQTNKDDFTSPTSCYHNSVKKTADDGEHEDSFGRYVAISDGLVVIGADGSQNSTGSAYIFKKSNGGLWTQEMKLVPKDGMSGNRFGICVATFGQTVAIGADGAGDGAGAVYIYGELANGTWTQTQKLSADTSKMLGFGSSIAIFDKNLAVGASISGGVNIYEKSDNGNWIEVQTVDKRSTGFGRNGLGISNSTMVVGDEVTQYAYIYEKIADVWTEAQTMRPNDIAEDDHFGISADIYGDTLVVSSFLADTTNGLDSGAVYIFEKERSGEWIQSAKLLPDSNVYKFGLSAVVSRDTVLVGAKSGIYTTYLFEKEPEGTWVEIFKDGPFETNSVGISIPDGTVVLGSPSDYKDDIKTGSVYFFCHTPSINTISPTISFHPTSSLRPSIAPTVSKTPSSHPSYQPTAFIDSWTRVRHVPPGDKWHPATDNLAGTDTYGIAENDGFAWSINFEDAVPGFNEFLFSTGDGTSWIITTVDAVSGSFYTNEYRPIIRSSFSEDPYVAKWYNRERYSEDPQMTIIDHDAIHTRLYVENGFDVENVNPSLGADVYIRRTEKNTTHPSFFPTSYSPTLSERPTISVQPTSLPSESPSMNPTVSFLPSIAPSVSKTPSSSLSYRPTSFFDSWTRVRHLPPGDKWHPATDNLAGTDIYGDASDDNSAWSINFEDAVPVFNEFLFSSGDRSDWLIATKNSVIGSSYYDGLRPIIRSSLSEDSYDARWRLVHPGDPWVSLANYFTGSGTLRLYGEANLLTFQIPSGGADVYIRYRDCKSLTVTKSRKSCQRWDSQEPHSHDYSPDNYPSLEKNYCRNPDGKEFNWCYTTDSSTEWEFCLEQCCGNPLTCGCADTYQSDYRGYIAETISGKKCQRWNSQVPQKHDRTPKNYPCSGLEENYCRNPDGEDGAWCYTEDPDKRWEYCDVPECQ